MEAVNIALSAATLIVIAAAAIAAVVQLKHLRTSNQLAGLLEILNQWNQPSVQTALAELIRIPEKLDDPSYAAMLTTPEVRDRAKHPEFLAMDLWEQIGTYNKHGFIDENVLLDIIAWQVQAAWQSAAPAVAILRQRGGPSTLENFEYLAVRAKQFTARFPNGTYPAGVPRMGTPSAPP